MEHTQAKEWQSSSKQDQHGQQQVIHSHHFKQQSEAFHEQVMPFDQKTIPFNEFPGQMLQFKRQMVQNNEFDQRVVSSRSFQSLSQSEQGLLVILGVLITDREETALAVIRTSRSQGRNNN
ncbi:OLC1v1035741C1 [Oldenlandia corymbosa var. corymbosa]|uniref:OLC1v1035741C1 n=1 Tax=Oldenlandia corymbosa var. corymbosa TaxID=529605 RepID=A0AAV1CX31_OLDCO|nr:OLC1v1035741C1 [Oldenlandia corymbosa var. corymbosa]